MTPVDFLQHWRARGVVLRLTDDCMSVAFGSGSDENVALFDSEEAFLEFREALTQHASEVGLLLGLQRLYRRFACRYEVPPHQRAEDLALLEGNGDVKHLLLSIQVLIVRPSRFPDCMHAGAGLAEGLSPVASSNRLIPNGCEQTAPAYPQTNPLGDVE